MRICFSQAPQPEVVMRSSSGSESRPIFDCSTSIRCNTSDPRFQGEDPPSIRSAGQAEEVVASLGVARCSSTAVARMSEIGFGDLGKHHAVTEAETIGNEDSDLSPCRHSSTMTSMASSCDPELCRSVLLHKALRRLGLHFASNQGSDMEYSLSEQTSDIDDFISHDWRTGRWSKLCSMLVVYNGRLAVVASSLAAVPLCALQTDAVGLLPREAFRWKEYEIGPDKIDMTVGYWCMAVSGPIFLLFLCFGHNLAVLFSRGAGQRQVFVDKLCICQTDADRKTKGIRALAGILKQSRRLVILWSPRYFTRLWCVYELTSWVHHQAKHRQPKPIRFEPVAWGHIILGAWALTYTTCLMWMIADLPAWLDFLAFGVFAAVAHYIRLFTQELVLIPDQVANFHVEASECYCCAVGHVHPQTGVSIPCDRELINGTLVTWSESQASSPAHGSPSHGMSPTQSLAQSMHHFDSEVNIRLKQWATKSVGLAPFPYEYALLALSPCAWHFADRMSGVLSKNLTAELYFIELSWMASWAFLYLPVAAKVGMFMAVALSRRCPVKQCGWVCSFLVTVLATLVVMIVSAILFYPMKLLILQRNCVPYILATCAWVPATLAVFNMDRLLRKLRFFISTPHD